MFEETIILSVGGSIIIPEKIDSGFVKKFVGLVNRHGDKRFVIVCGGGHIARYYRDTAKKLNKVSDEDLDWVGIKATKLNAEFIRSVFGSLAYEKVVDDPTAKISTEKRVIIAAGWKPGCSTDMDAVYLAENFNASMLINLSNIEYVYDKDPRKFKDACKKERLTWKEFRSIVGDKWTPGLNAPFDPVAAKQSEKIGLKVIIANGKDIDNLDNILAGKKFRGTVVE